MMPIHPHAVSSTLLALPVAIVVTQKLVHNLKASTPVEAGSSDDRMNQIERRAKTLTETLKNIVGYHHHGIND
jgi:hypothetical protein